jgi:hypothetical protein
MKSKIFSRYYLQMKYIRENSTDAHIEGKLYKGFKAWIRRTYPEGAPDDEQWETILDQSGNELERPRRARNPRFIESDDTLSDISLSPLSEYE